VTFADPIAWEETLPIRPSSPAWRAVVRAIYGAPLIDDDRALFLQLSGGREPPDGGADEFLAVAGRRGGKSETIARLAVFEAIHGGHQLALAPGQLGLIPIISPLREQSGEVIRYVKGLCKLSEVAPYVAADRADSVEFRSGVVVAVMTADSVNVSGPTVVMAIREEWAKHPGDEAAVPDREIDNSLRPALAPVEGAPRRRLIGITSAYIQEGLAFETDEAHFGKPDAPVLVVRGPSHVFNQNLNRAWLERERKRVGESVFAREYLGIWQPSIVDGWFGDFVDLCVDKGREILPFDRRRTYFGAIDAAFRGDGFTTAICHRERNAQGKPITICDGVWQWKGEKGEPLPVALTVSRSANIIKEYRARCWADQFSLDPLKEMYRERGVHLLEAPWTAQTKPARFRRVRDAMVDGLLRLPDDRDLLREFYSIRGRLLRSGGEAIEARSGHDDRVFALVLAASEAMEREPPLTDKRAIEARARQVAAVGNSLFAGGNFLGVTNGAPDPMQDAIDFLEATKGL
jgi:hypothetical protein